MRKLPLLILIFSAFSLYSQNANTGDTIKLNQLAVVVKEKTVPERFKCVKTAGALGVSGVTISLFGGGLAVAGADFSKISSFFKFSALP